jgi:hypothetical protein
LAIDERTVERPEIADTQLAVRLEQFTMLSAYERMGQLDRTRPTPAKDRGQSQFEFLGTGSARDHDKFRFHGPMIKPTFVGSNDCGFKADAA